MAKAYLIIQDTMIMQCQEDNMRLLKHTCIGYTYELDVVRWFVKYNPTMILDMESSIIEIEYDNIVEFTRLLSFDYGMDDKIDEYLLAMHTDTFGNRVPLYEQSDGQLRPWFELLNKIDQDMFELCTVTSLMAMKFIRDNKLKHTISEVFLGNAEKFDLSRMDLRTLYIQSILNDNNYALDYYVFDNLNR